MKTFTFSSYWQTLICIAILFSFVSCEDKVEITRTYTIYEPVYLTLSEIRGGFEITEPVEISARGKLYLYKNFVLINDPGKGIHIVDNSDQSNPNPIHYINLPGNYDFAVRGDVLYADSYMDLVMLDISDINNINIVNRIEDIFINDEVIFDPDSGLVVDYTPKEIIQVTSEEVSGYFPDVYYWGGSWENDRIFFTDAMINSVAMSENYSAPPATLTGIGGSMAKFTIVNQYLYTIDSYQLKTFDISNPELPNNSGTLDLNWDIETIFPYENNLFVGSQTGMYIVELNDPSAPSLLTTYSHMASCDPVVVQGDRAYVTLRGGTSCRQSFTNQLEVIDISDLSNPTQIAVYEMESPYGLGIDGDALFICEGENGLKVFDASDDLAIDDNQIASYPTIDAYDVIPYQKTLFLIGDDGLYQFDYTDINNISQISKLNIKETTKK